MSKFTDSLAGFAVPMVSAYLDNLLEQGLESYIAHNPEETVKQDIKLLHDGLVVLERIVKSTKTLHDDTVVHGAKVQVEEFSAENNILL